MSKSPAKKPLLRWYRQDSDNSKSTHICPKCGAEWRKFMGGMSLMTEAPIGCGCDQLEPILRPVLTQEGQSK